MSNNQLRVSNWKKPVLISLIISLVIVLVNLFIVNFYSSTIWLYAGYFFGTTFKTTLGTLLFVEAIIVLTLGFVWLSGAMEAKFDGSNIKTNIYNRKEQWNQRSNELEQENIAGKVMVFIGLPILLVSLVLIFL